MATSADYLTQLQADKQTLVDNLVTKGVEATNDETFTSLVPKVLDIQTGGGSSKYAPKRISFYEYNGTDLDYELSNLDTSNITNMGFMFQYCTNVTKLDLSNFNTSKVTYMRSMFHMCTSIEELDLSVFDTTTVTDTGYMCNNCTKLTKLIINNSNVFKMTDADMLYNTPIQKGNGYVYVPDELVDTYKTANNWSTYANQIKPLSELPTI